MPGSGVSGAMSRRGTLAALAAATLVLVAGFGGTAAASSGGNPAPTATPDALSVSLTDGDGTANATYRVNTTTGTINASYAGGKADVNVSYADSATAIQFALDNATATYDTGVVGGGTFNGSVDVGSRTGLTLDGGYSRLDGDAGRGDTVDVTSDGTTVRNLTVVDSPDTGIDGLNADDVTLRNVESLDSASNGIEFANGTVRNVTIRGGNVGLSQGNSNGSTIAAVTIRQAQYTGLEINSANNTIRDVTVNDTTSGRGIFEGGVNNTYTNVTVTNSSTEGFEVGESEVSSTNATLRNVTVEDNAADGIIADEGDGVLLSNVTAVDNGDAGIYVSKGTVLTDSRASNNGDGSESGVRVDERNVTLRNVTATGSPEGFNVRNPNATLTDVVARNNSHVGFRVKDRNATLTDVVARDNADGIRIVNDGFDATLRNATVANNSGDGVYLEDRSARGLLIADATVRDNGNAGIDVSPQTGSRILDTTLTANGGPELDVRPTTDDHEVSPASLDASNVTVGATTFDAIEAKNVSFEGTVTPPSPGAGRERVESGSELSGT